MIRVTLPHRSLSGFPLMWDSGLCVFVCACVLPHCQQDAPGAQSVVCNCMCVLVCILFCVCVYDLLGIPPLPSQKSRNVFLPEKLENASNES